jgi:hypothetical protein
LPYSMLNSQFTFLNCQHSQERINIVAGCNTINTYKYYHDLSYPMSKYIVINNSNAR